MDLPDYLKTIFELKPEVQSLSCLGTALFGKYQGSDFGESGRFSYVYLPKAGLMISDKLRGSDVEVMLDLIRSGNFTSLLGHPFSRERLRRLYRHKVVRDNLTPYRVMISNPLPYLPEMVMDCRYSIKFFSFKSDSVRTVSKKAVFNDFVDQEIKARLDTVGRSISPDIIASGKINGRSYLDEALVASGFPVVDVNGKLNIQSLENLMSQLLPFYRGDTVFANTVYYSEKLVFPVRDNIGQKTLDKLVNFFRVSESGIVLTKAHGDMVPSNIMMDPEGKAKLVDWTYYGKKSLLHDLMTLLCHLASSKGIDFSYGLLMDSIVNRNKTRLNSLFEKVINEPDKEDNSGLKLASPMEYLLIYLLERINLWKDTGNRHYLKNEASLMSDVIECL